MSWALVHLMPKAWARLCQGHKERQLPLHGHRAAWDHCCRMGWWLAWVLLVSTAGLLTKEINSSSSTSTKFLWCKSPLFRGWTSCFSRENLRVCEKTQRDPAEELPSSVFGLDRGWNGILHRCRRCTCKIFTSMVLTGIIHVSMQLI